jgi:hypothetical protein
MMHNTSHTKIKHIKCSESSTLLYIKFKIQLQSFTQKRKNKIHCESANSTIKNDTLPQRCRSQNQLTSGERENTSIKQHQDKTWATKARQDWLINMAINSRLPVRKAWRDKLYHYAKPALRVDPYFQVLALFKIISKERCNLLYSYKNLQPSN